VKLFKLRPHNAVVVHALQPCVPLYRPCAPLYRPCVPLYGTEGQNLQNKPPTEEELKENIQREILKVPREELLQVNSMYLDSTVLGGLVVSMLAIGPKVCKFTLGQGQWIFKGDTNLQHALLWSGSKAIGPCHKILRHVKNNFEV
jgi:hypothetical protein